MVSKEQIAHDLTMLYLYNRYGTIIHGSSTLNGGSVNTVHFPKVTDPKFTWVRKRAKGFLGNIGLENEVKVQSGFAADENFEELVEEYRCTYERFLEALDNE